MQGVLPPLISISQQIPVALRGQIHGPAAETDAMKVKSKYFILRRRTLIFIFQK
jgi:hypothetical protein